MKLTILPGSIEPDLRVSLLQAAPSTLLCEIIGAAARALSREELAGAEWLKSAKDAGSFGAAPFLRHQEELEIAMLSNESRMRLRNAAVRAALNCFGRVEHGTVDHDPVYGRLESPARVAHLHATTMQQEHLALLVRTVIEDDQAIKASTTTRMFADAVAVSEDTTMLHSQLTSAACVANMPGLVAEIAAHNPQCLETPAPQDDVYGASPWAADTLYHMTFWATPLYSALQLSRDHCIDALFNGGLSRDPVIGCQRLDDSRHSNEVPSRLEHFVQTHRPAALPSTFATLLKHMGLVGDSASPTLGHIAIRSLHCDAGAFEARFLTYKPVFVESGHYLVDPLEALAAACARHPDLLDVITPLVPWEQVGAVFPAVGRILDDNPDISEEEASRGLVRLLDIADAAGTSLPYQPIEHETDNGMGDPTYRLEPHTSIISNGFRTVIQRFIERGMDPSLPLLPGWQSPYELAQDADNDTVDLMRAAMARKIAGDALASLGPASPAPSHT